MDYQSFKHNSDNSEKSKGGFFQRFKSKINSQDANKIENIKEESANNYPKKNVSPISVTNTNKEAEPVQLPYTPNSELVYKRHPADYIQDKITISGLIKSVTSNFSTIIQTSSENVSTTEKVDRGYWMPDSICRKCYSCEDEFSAIKRKHHCRMCGQIFCYRCCSDVLPGSLWNLVKPQRSCRRCFMSFYSHNDSRKHSIRDIQSRKPSQISRRHSKYNISPRGSIASENLIAEDTNLLSSKKSLSFSSNDISALMDSPDLELDPDTDDEFQLIETKRNVSEIEEATCDPKFQKTDQKRSINRMYYKYIFPSNILSKEKFFGNKSVSTLGSSEISTDQDHYKRELLMTWKLIINETEKYRKYYTTKIRVQNQTRIIEQQFSFPNDEEDISKITLPVVISDVSCSKSCIHGSGLIEWIVKNSEVTDLTRATAICQSYLEMQLLYPFFADNESKVFKNDGTLYVIREFTAECSPLTNYNNFFFHETGYSITKKSIGNSVFYMNDENHNPSIMSNNDESQIKSPKILHAHSRNIYEDGDYDFQLSQSVSKLTSSNLWNRNCMYLEKLLKQELRDYNLDVVWCNVILPVCKRIIEKVVPVKPSDKSVYDIRNYVHIKKIPNSTKNECRAVESVVMSKNIDLQMKKEIRNPRVMLIRSSIEYWRHKKLVSIDPLLLQEEEYLKNCVIKIKNLQPDIVVVEGSVSLIAKEIMEKFGLILVSNVRKEQMERLSRMLGATIFDSIDSIGANLQSSLGTCSQFMVQRYTLMNGRKKTLLFFKLLNSSQGCTLLLHGKSLRELVLVKYVTKFIMVAFKNAFLELSFWMNFHVRAFPKSESIDNSSSETVIQNDSTSTFVDIIQNRHVAMSANVQYKPPAAVLRSISNPEDQSRLLSLEIINLSWKERLNDVLKRKQRHICAELYDIVRMNTRKHPLLCDPEYHAFTNSFYDKKLDNKGRCMLYSDFRQKGSRFYPVQDDLENSLISTVNFDSSDLACRVGFLTKSQEIKWRTMEKKKFDSIYDSFNPRNYQRILLLYSIQTSTGICEKPKKISLNYYESTDRTLGNFVSSMLNDMINCPAKCEIPIFDHVYKFVSNGGCVQVSLHVMNSEPLNKVYDASPEKDSSPKIKLWNWCSRCDKLLTLQTMSDETWNFSLGRFFDILFNLNSSYISINPAQCTHSLQTDVHYYFTMNAVNKALEFKYVPIKTYEFQTPSVFIAFKQKDRSMEEMLSIFKNLYIDIEEAVDVKNRYNLVIKQKLMELKDISKEKEHDLCDFLTKESNSIHYTQRTQNLYNLMDEIYNATTENFNVELFETHENFIKDEIKSFWTDIGTWISNWDSRLTDAFEQEKLDKRLSKTESKNVKNSSDNLLLDSDTCRKETYPVFKIDKSVSVFESREPLEKPGFPSDLLIQSFDDSSVMKYMPGGLEIPCQTFPLSRTSTEISFENLDETDFISYKKDKTNYPKEIDIKQVNQIDKASINSNTMQPFRKFFTGLFNQTGYKTLEDPTCLSDSYFFQNIDSVKTPVLVKDDNITSVVAFCLSSDVYLEMLNEYSKQSNSNTTEKFEIFPRMSMKSNLKITPELSNMDAFNISLSCSVSNNDKRNTIKNESVSKDRDVIVRYLHHADTDDLSDVNDQENQSYFVKQDTDDIKIQLSTEDTLIDDNSQKTASSTKQTPKAPLSSDFLINLNNNKVKCTCKIYFAKQFHDLRQKMFQMDDINFIRSLSECKSWVTTGGKSGLKFRKTLDDRFIIKQLQLVELDGFKKFHKKYFEYILEKIQHKEPCSLAKILGVYQVDYYNSLTKATEKMDFIVMENVFYDQKPSRIFDLKGNKLGAANLTAEKISVSDDSVMQDKDFINYCRTNPVYVSWQAQIALKETLTRDTEFLQCLPVMDYSLLVGMDDNNNILVIGIIDYLRMFTMNKLIEMHLKQKLLVPHGELPTVIQPQKYQKRFLEAMEEYFLVCPIPWDYLLLYPSNLNSTVNKKQNFSFDFSSIFPTKPNKPSKPTKPSIKGQVVINADENKLRLGILDDV